MTHHLCDDICFPTQEFAQPAECLDMQTLPKGAKKVKKRLIIKKHGMEDLDSLQAIHL